MEDARRLRRMEAILAGLLRYGALVACGWIVVGMMLGTVGAGPAGRCLAVGIVLLIALPVIRVALTAAVFLYERDYLFAAIADSVLLIILLGLLLGTGVD